MDYQKLYEEERRNRENILRMQKTIMADNDDYIMAFSRLRGHLAALRGEEGEEDENELTPPEASQLVEDVGVFMRKSCRPCECDRWKALYKQESEETIRISQ